MTMEFQPLVTIVIPVYNGSNFLEKAIESALRQTYPHVEVIVVNDGSTDGGLTENVARKYADSIVYIAKPNGGVSSALNAGIRRATGDYVAWLSHDDVFLEEKIEWQIESLQDMQNRDVILFADYDYIDSTSSYLCPSGIDFPDTADMKMNLICYHSTHGCTTLVPRSLFDKIGFFDESLLYVQDYDFWFRASWKTPFVFLDKVVVHSRVHENQGSRAATAGMLKESDKLYERMVQEYTEANPSLGLKQGRDIIGGLLKKGLPKTAFRTALAWLRTGRWRLFLGSYVFILFGPGLLIRLLAFLRQRVLHGNLRKSILM